MTEEISPNDWRGQCLEYFARGEQKIGECLEAAHIVDNCVKLRHLAGHRLADVILLSKKQKATAKQKAALHRALNNWQEIEAKRQYFAHGVGSVAHDTQGDWVLILDIVKYRTNGRTDERWAIKQDEARRFLKDLAEAFKSLSGELGHFRKRLKTP